jgi:hypothetical protein
MSHVFRAAILWIPARVAHHLGTVAHMLGHLVDMVLAVRIERR